MLLIDRPARDIAPVDMFDNSTQEFYTIPGKHFLPIHLQLEHSLKSIAKWEGRWKKPFLSNDEMSTEELVDYVRCMTVNQQKNPAVYDGLTMEDLAEILKYMEEPMSARKIREAKKTGRKRRKETAETIYYAMIQYGIPMECENWHFNRLSALIDCCAENGNPDPGYRKPKNQKELLEFYRALNEKNRKKYNSKG